MQAFETFHPQSKIWIYQASRLLTDQEKQHVLVVSNAFASQWHAHDLPLQAASGVLHDAFLIFSVNQQGEQASGCSIDKQVHVVKQLENDLNLSFTDRLKVAYREHPGGVLQILSHTALIQEIESRKKSSQGYIYQNTITQLSQLNDQWLVPLSQSWMAALISNPQNA